MKMYQVRNLATICVIVLLPAVWAIDNGLGLSPPLGWRSYNAFGGRITQAIMTEMMNAMVDRSRTVDGKPTSLLDLGYARVGLDGGWNYCFAENHTFHWASDGRPVWNDGFPDPEGMVAKAHALGLKPGWYLNNCGCSENHFEGEMIEKVMRGSVKMLVDQGWDGVKLDSCSQFHNLTHWAELINQTGHAVMIENCHQGAYTPGMQQWQAYIKNGTKSYSHYLGMFFRMEAAQPLHNITFADCRDHCDSLGTDCQGFCFVSREAEPASIDTCYVTARAFANHMDMSNANYCTGDSSPSDCPFNIYRVSGDISPSWRGMMANLEHTLPYLGEGGVHLPYPQGPTVRSRPGGWAYPDMLEVGNLANATEDRSHFGAWVVVSSPLILSFNLTDLARMDRAWPIISNKALITVNQRWAGSPGRRVSVSEQGWQVWAKPMGDRSFAVFLLNAGQEDVHASVPLVNISAVFSPDRSACMRDLYTRKVIAPLSPGEPLHSALAAHDSAFYCAWPSDAQGGCDGPAANDCPSV